MSVSAFRRRWLQSRRFKRTAAELRSLPPHEIRALGISPQDITRLAAEVARL